ncbi:hypothetical protein D4R20_00050 [bacterium]|nr:MAG: hypothetical protein D4R20_00050 [bacterium]
MQNSLKTLVKIFLKIDYRDKENSGKRKFWGIMISYLLANGILAFNNFRVFDKESYIILSFSTGLFLLTLIVLNDFTNLFFTKQHSDLVKTLPVKSSDIFTAKFFSAFSYISIFPVVIVLPQAVFLWLTDYNLLSLIGFVVLNILFIYFITGIIIFIYSLALDYFTQKAFYLLYIVQFLFFSFVMFSSSIASRSILADKMSIANLWFLSYTPQVFFARGIDNFPVLTVCLIITGGTYFLFYLFLKNRYYSISDKLYLIEAKTERKGFKFPKFNFSFIERYVLRNNLERASFGLVKNGILSSRAMKLRLIPLVFLPIIIALIGVISNIPNLIVFTPKDMFDVTSKMRVQMVNPSLTMTLILCIRLFYTNLKIADEGTPDVKWIFSSLPIYSRKYFLIGAYKLMNVYFIIPVMIILFAIMCIRVSPEMIAVNLAFIFAVTYFINSVIIIFDKTLPFTIESTKYNSVSRFGEIMLTVVFGVVIFVCQIFIFENVIFALITILVLIATSMLLNRVEK